MALSYDPKQIPQPTTDTQAFLNAILVELRAIRIALEEQRRISIHAVSDNNTPVVKKR